MIAAIGNPVYDHIVTPYVTTGGRVLSGCSTNACIIESKLGLRCGLTGSVGEDFRSTFEEDLRSFGIDYVIQPSRETGGFYLEYDENGDRILNLLGVADPIRSFPEKYLDADVIVVGPILGEVSLDLLKEIRDGSDAMVFLDPQGFVRQIEDRKAVRRRHPQMEDVVGTVDIVKPNEHEAEIMTGLDATRDTERICEVLHSWGASISIVTLGSHGSVAYDGEEFVRLPAYATEARDPTGAGDTFMGGFIFEYLRTGDLLSSALFATCTSSFVVETVGPQFPVTERAVRERVASLRESLGM
ncbi:ribokinase [archaeon]|nr:MAG: ribokinase [archaeon]